MVYYANGGFNWHDLYFMPTKLREFYWRELNRTKEDETKSIESSKSSSSKSSKVKRR